MSSKMVGIEIGSSTLKMAVCSGGKIKTMAARRMPEDLVREGKIAAPGMMSKFIKDMRREFHIPGGACSLVLPGGDVISNHVIMPVMNEEELILNLPYEFRDFVGKDASKYFYDYSVMRVESGSVELQAAAVRKDAVENYAKILKNAGLALKVATPAEMAWANLIRCAQNVPQKICIVDVGHRKTQVSIYADGNFLMGKEFEMGGAVIDEIIASEQQIESSVARIRKEENQDQILSGKECYDAYQAMTYEVMKIVNFYSYSDNQGGSRLEDIYYCGGSSVIAPFRELLQDTTGMKLHAIHELLPDGISRDLALSCAVAVGAAVQDR